MASMETTEKTPELVALNEAIDMTGGIAEFARSLNLSGSAVAHQWRLNRVPAEHCPSVEELTKGAVRCERLRPDVKWHVLRGTLLAA